MGRHPWGGSEELWAGAAKYLASDSHQVYACIQGWRQTRSQVTALAQARVQINERPYLPSNRWLALSQKVFRHALSAKGPYGFDRWLRSVQPDLVCVSNGGYCDGMPFMTHLAERDIPFVSIVQANAPHWWPSDSQLEALQTVYQKASAVCCVSQSNLHLLRHMLALPLPQARVVWNPFQVRREDPPPWPTSSVPWRLACVARLDPDAKGQDLLFEILARPEWRQRQVTLSLFGAGDSAAGLKALSTSLGLDDRVRFHGQVSDIASIWRDHHCLVLPSRFEGLPLALVEALLCGRPAVVTDIAGNPEVVQDGVSGFIAAAPTTERLSEALERAWQARDNWQAMGTAARQHMLAILPDDPCREFANQLLKLATSEL